MTRSSIAWGLGAFASFAITINVVMAIVVYHLPDFVWVNLLAINLIAGPAATVTCLIRAIENW